MKSGILILVIVFVSCFGLSEGANCPSADLTKNCVVDFGDFALMAEQWLTVGSYDLTVNSYGISGVIISSSTGYSGTTNYAMGLTAGTSVTLTAPARFGDKSFIRWAGDVNSTNQTISFSMDADKTVMADYAPMNMFWVSINDPGITGHVGFTGEMSKYETTNAQYCQFLNTLKACDQIMIYNDIVYPKSDTSHSQPYCITSAAQPQSQISFSSGTFSVCNRDGYSMENHPVVYVSWYGATAFCNYYHYRLPSEWEWQAVADYDGSFTYGCGTTINQSKANYFAANPIGLSSFPYTSPVGYYPAVGYGICDMAGNVMEWTSSCSSSDCSYNSRVVRGGGWSHSESSCTVSYRDAGHPSTLSGSTGFRVCR